MAPFVLALMWILAPIAWPTAKLLDKLLGEDHGTVYKKSGLKTLVTLHKTLGSSPTDRLNQDEVTIISAVLDLKDKAVGDIMTPMEDVFTMSADTILDEDTMNVILSAGYSRIPIYEPGNDQNFVGMLLVKILITYDPEDCKKVSDFALATLPETRPETSCLDIVNFFQEGKSHMVLVSEFPGENYGATGVVTLEDVIEELIGESVSPTTQNDLTDKNREIIDESDVYIDVHKAIRRMAPAPKARVQKGQVVGNPDNPVIQAPEDYLIDLTEDGQNGVDIAKRLVNGDHRSNTYHVFGTSPKTTFLRRSSSGADGHPITIRGNANEMREHLKHLGPSNLASRPKTTRYQSVKIKPGTIGRHGSTTESVGYPHSIVEEPYHDDPTMHVGEGQGLLNSAGSHAKDGIMALQQGYGAMTYSPTKERDSNDSNKDEAASYQPSTSRKSFKDHSPDGLSMRHSDRSSDTLGSLHSGVSPSRRKRGTARSGSITENIRESGGFQKVVLETTSSEDMEENISNGKSGDNSPTIVAANPLPPTSTQEPSQDPKGEEVKKKRRRNRKKKGGKNGEEGSTAEASMTNEGSTTG
jgi:metal transporter CNNM